MKLIINIKEISNINYMNMELRELNTHIYTNKKKYYKEIKFSWKNVLRMNKMINMFNIDIEKKPYIMSI